MFLWKILSFTIILLSIDYISSTEEQNVTFFDELNQAEYAEYMRDVIKELETDKDFQDKILNKNGSASQEDYFEALEFASESTRNKLDEIKRREIERLNLLKLQLKRMVKRNMRLPKDRRDEIVKGMTSDDKNHLYSSEDSKFTKGDLEKLIFQIQHDLRQVDAVREQQYRRHEWKKDWRKRKELEKFQDPIKKNQRLEEIKKAREFYKNHKRINEPGSEEQMKELWKTMDNLDSGYFNIKTFFNLHDLNQDGQWDIGEIEAMVLPDIQKVYQDEKKIGDVEEKYHEIMKMRQHFMEKMDSDKDEIITLDEFVEYSKKNDFKSNKEWKITEENDQLIYSEEDIKRFEKELDEIHKSSPVLDSQNLNNELPASQNVI